MIYYMPRVTQSEMSKQINATYPLHVQSFKLPKHGPISGRLHELHLYRLDFHFANHPALGCRTARFGSQKVWIVNSIAETMCTCRGHTVDAASKHARIHL